MLKNSIIFQNWYAVTKESHPEIKIDLTAPNNFSQVVYGSDDKFCELEWIQRLDNNRSLIINSTPTDITDAAVVTTATITCVRTAKADDVEELKHSHTRNH